MENIFQWQGSHAHEIVFIYAASFSDDAAYEIAEQRILDDVDGSNRVVWRAPASTSPPLFPEGITDLVRQAIEVGLIPDLPGAC